jgi:pimeloyl-ACP methyl ester carboxylesterase
MEIANINGIDLQYDVKGSGEPVILIHGAIIADANFPLIMQSNLTKKYQMIHYHRRGYAGSSNNNSHVGISEQANDCLKLMQYLGIDRGHIVGHSIGGTIALQLAIDYPNYVQSLSLLEPSLTGYNPQGDYQVIQEFMPLIQIYDKGQRSEAIDNFLKMTIGIDYRNLIDKMLPANAFDLAVIDAKIFFYDEIPAMKSWAFNYDDVKKIIQKPVLYIRGSDSGQRSLERQQIVLKLLPQTKVLEIDKAKHMIQIMNPVDLAENLADFFADHPL